MTEAHVACIDCWVNRPPTSAMRSNNGRAWAERDGEQTCCLCGLRADEGAWFRGESPRLPCKGRLGLTHKSKSALMGAP